MFYKNTLIVIFKHEDDAEKSQNQTSEKKIAVLEVSNLNIKKFKNQTSRSLESKHQEVYFQTLGSLKSAWQRMLKHALSSSPFARKHYKQVDTG